MYKDQNKPLMPKGTAVWLIENTSLTFEQIANFCGLHQLEIQGIADGDVARGVIGMDPIKSKQLTREEITRCEKDQKANLQFSEESQRLMKAQGKKISGSKYTPVARRQDKPDAILWLLKHCPEMHDSQITKLIGTTKQMIESVRERVHWNIANLKPRDPVLLDLCSQTEIDRVYGIAKARAEALEEKKRKIEEAEIENMNED